MSTVRDLEHAEQPQVTVGQSMDRPSRPQPSRPAGEGSSPRFRLELCRSVRMHPLLVTCILLAELAAGAAYLLSTWPRYEAECVLYAAPSVSAAVSSPNSEMATLPVLKQQVENTLGDEVLRGALHKLPPGAWQHDGEGEQAAIERLRGSITVEGGDDARHVSIAAAAPQASLAADLANAVAASLVESAAVHSASGAGQWVQLAAQELDRTRNALAAARAEQEHLQRMAATAAALSTSPARNSAEQIDALRLELAKARAEEEDAVGRLVSALDSPADLHPRGDALDASDPAPAALKTSLDQRRAQLVAEMAGLSPQDSLYRQNAEELARVNADLEGLRNRMQTRAAMQFEAGLRDDLERSASHAAKLNSNLAQIAETDGSASRQQRAIDLAMDVQRLQARYSALEEQYRWVAGKDEGWGTLLVSASAQLPMNASILPLVQEAAVLLLGSLVLALGSAVVAHKLDPRVYIAADVERLVGFSPIAQLPDLNQVPPEVAEEFFSQLAASVQNPCVITGLAPGIGTSIIASRLSNALEHQGCPSAVLTASATVPDPRDEIVRQFLEETDAGTLVLVDAPPVLSSRETEYLARFVDSAMVVIQSGLTTRAQIRQVTLTLQRLQVSVASFVLNRVPIKADPSFRRSVRAIEQRLAIRDRLLQARPSPGNEERPGQRQPVVSERDPFKPPDDHPIPESSATPGEQPHAAAPGSASAGPVSESVRPPRVTRGRGEPARSGGGARSLRAAPSPRAVPPGLSATPEPPPAPVPARRAPSAPNPEPSSRAPLPLEPPPALNAPPQRRTPATPTQPLHDDLVAEHSENRHHPESRLSGLRNLLVNLGRRSLVRDQEDAGDSDADLEPRFERATVRPAYDETQSDASGEAIPSRLTAQPEFLRPKPAAEPEKDEKEVVVRPTPTRRDNPDPDEIQTLPSWRGQYRKKRYPPL